MHLLPLRSEQQHVLDHFVYINCITTFLCCSLSLQGATISRNIISLEERSSANGNWPTILRSSLGDVKSLPSWRSSICLLARTTAFQTYCSRLNRPRILHFSQFLDPSTKLSSNSNKSRIIYYFKFCHIPMIASNTYRNIARKNGRVRRHDLNRNESNRLARCSIQLTMPTPGRGNSSKKQVIAIGGSLS